MSDESGSEERRRLNCGMKVARSLIYKALLGTLSVLTVTLALTIPSISVGARSPANTTLALPVVSCPTTYASPPSRSSQATTTSVSVPKSSSHDFSLYSDSKRTLVPLLAPRGWHCKVLVAEDGSVSLTLYPTKTPPASAGYASAEQIMGISDGACQGCVADDVCPYFENAQAQLGFAGTNCTTTKPNDEQDSFVSGSNTSYQGMVDIYDPTTKKSKYPIYEVLRYSDTTGEGTDAREVCVLPKSELSLCRIITSEFVSKNWGFASSVPAPVTTTTESPTTSSPACSSTQLFALYAQAEPSASPTYVPSENGPISVYCSGGWAVLQNFTIQVGSGDGIGLFKQVGSDWTLAVAGDNSGGGAGYNPCAQYPAAALQALGSNLCSSNSGNSGNSGSTSNSGNTGNSGNTTTTLPPGVEDQGGDPCQDIIASMGVDAADASSYYQLAAQDAANDSARWGPIVQATQTLASLPETGDTPAQQQEASAAMGTISTFCGQIGDS